MSLWQVARDRGNQIARELNLRKASELVHPSVRRLFDRALADMANTPDASAMSRLRGLYRSREIQRRRPLQTAVALLELAWRIPPESRLEEDVVAMISDCYLDASPVECGHIRDELRDRQVHPFPRVRRVACLVRQLDEVDAPELAELAELDRGYPDVRISIAERVVKHNQIEHLAAVIKYLSSVLQSAGQDPNELRAAKKLFAQFPLLERSHEALQVLYLAYVTSYESPEPRGYLMRGLVRYGDLIVPPLVFEHDNTPANRVAIEHLLSQIVSYGGIEATRALLKLLLTARVQDLHRLCNFLGKATQTLADHAAQNDQASVVREEVLNNLAALARRRDPDIRRFIDHFKTLKWGGIGVTTVIDMVLSGDADLRQVRKLGHAATKQLMAVSENQSVDPTRRRRALEVLPILRAHTISEMAPRLWSIFVASDVEEIRIAVLHALAGLELDPGAEARDALFALSKSGSPRLSTAIRNLWDKMFRAVGLAELPQQRGDR